MGKRKPINREQLELAAHNATNFTEIMIALGYKKHSGGPRDRIKQACEEYRIEIPKLSIKSKIAAANAARTIPLKEILIENSLYTSTTQLKKRLLKEKILQNICNICKHIPMWNNKKLTLQLDHINGISSDNRLENLQILCPNCHSQTDNYGGRNYGRYKKEGNFSARKSI